MITGAGSGLGRAIAVEIGRRGGRVLVTDIARTPSEETAELVVRAGGEAQVLVVDVTRCADLAHAADVAEKTWGGTDLLVNNAGVAVAGMVGDVALADWEWILSINLWGAIHGCHAFVPRMKAQRSGFILNVASNAGIASLPEMAPYNVSKAAVISLSETLDSELAPYGIRVSALCPTFFATNLFSSMRSSSDRQRSLARAFFDRSRTTAEDVARAGLRGLEKGRLIVVPQLDGWFVWCMKRFLPGLYHFVLRWQQRRDLGRRLLLGPQKQLEAAEPTR